MKKSLLFAMSLLISVVVMAQEKTMSFTDFSRVQLSKELKPQKPSNAVIKTIKTFKDLSVNHSSNRAEGTFPYGDWIYSGMDGENPHVANSLSDFKMEEASVQDDDNGTVYNVKVCNLAGYVFSMYGIYDDEAGTLTIPSWQVVYTSESYGDCALAGFTGESYDDAIILEKDEKGNFSMENDGWDVIIVNEASEYYGYWLVENKEVDFFKPNAVCTFQAPTQTGYKEISGTAYVEDYGDQLNVYGMFSYAGDASITMIEMNTNGVATIPSDQQVDSEDQSEYIKTNYGIDGEFGYLRFVPWLKKVSDEEYDYATADDLEADLVYTYLSPLPCKISDDKTSLSSPFLFTFATAYVDGAGALNYGQFYGLSLALTEGTFSISTGISEVNTANKTATAKTYNMLGQQVNAGAKGLLIRDGRKFIAK